MRPFAEDWKILAKALKIHGGVRNLVHPTICSARRDTPLLFEKVKELKELER